VGANALQLLDVSFRVGSQTWLHTLNLRLAPGLNVLLGSTLAGKTTLMRVMAGLEQPSTGRVLIEDRDVTGVPVRDRNLAMVYQQFINYPSMTVYDNIASPLRLAKLPNPTIDQRVRALAETLRLTKFLERRPAELSGGQQQRTALARALAKDAELVLLDEPLVNLDYKLREDLRHELKQVFAQRRTTVVYATTEPQEALQLGGNTVVLSEGRAIQSGPTLDIFRRPATLEAARAFSDPPMNELHAQLDTSTNSVLLSGGLRVPLSTHALRALTNASRDVVLGIRAHQLALTPGNNTVAISGRVDLAEISGSETYIHLSREGQSLVARLAGIHDFALGAQCTLYFDPDDVYGFDDRGQLVFAPE
jgi:glycerol transport system ATP-binding protein